MNKKPPNRLITEKSPYLLQHAHNPVEWRAWNDETFNTAHSEDKPVFLSIGYSSCHWCHVMEEESFSDTEVAELINRVFIPVKVDREERPDLDSLYMLVCQMLTGRGGWPLTIILTPEMNPFFAATYIPKYSRSGSAGLMDLIPHIEDLWKHRRNDVYNSARSIINAVASLDNKTGNADIDAAISDSAFSQLSSQYDSRNGGFGEGAKFPNVLNLMFLLGYWKKSGNKLAREMVRRTLKSMRHGGIYDHAGSGYHRYAVDPEWKVPHFEKMLYDQALLSMAYNYAYLAFGDDKYKRNCFEILDFVLREMTSPNGGFYTSFDADSDGGEGKYYLWRYDELGYILKNDFIFFQDFYDIRMEGNFGEHGGDNGDNILFFKKNTVPLRKETADHISRCLEALLLEREKRARPFRDEKILVDWNGLMIAALALAGKSLNEKKYIESAKKAAGFIRSFMIEDGVLFHRYIDGEKAIQGFLDDYAYFSWGLLELYEATFDDSYLTEAVKISKDMVVLFGETGPFYIKSEHPGIQPLRHRELYDTVTPAGNSVAIMNLLRLGKMTGRSDYESRARNALESIASNINAQPLAHLYALMAAEYNRNSVEVVIAGSIQDQETADIIGVLNENFFPNCTVVLVPEDTSAVIPEISEIVKDKIPLNGKSTAYVCRNFSCLKPVQKPRDLLDLMKNL